MGDRQRLQFLTAVTYSAFLSDVGDIVYNFFALSVTALKPNPSPFEIFGLVPKSPIHAGLVSVR
jgi:hypothetical protein